MAKPGWELCSPKDSHTSDDAPFGLVSSESGGLNEESTNVRFFNEEQEGPTPAAGRNSVAKAP